MDIMGQPETTSAAKSATAKTTSIDDDRVLLLRIAQKDRVAFTALYHRNHQRLSRFLYRVTRRPDLVDELINDVMFVVWQKAAKFGGRSRVSTWILGIAYHKALKALDVVHNAADRFSAEVVEAIDRNGPEAALMNQQLQARLEVALQALPVEQRTVVELTFYHGYLYREIAEITGCSVNTIKTRSYHARKRLRKLLPELSHDVDAHKSNEAPQ